LASYAIKVENLSKKYRIDQGAKPQYKTLRDSLSKLLLKPFKQNGRINRNLVPPASTRFDSQGKLLWALREVSFEVKPGEIVGVIGANGAGKSTLLKVLTRITYPTHGTVDLYGRVGSLLEVGTGFHKELTGRENVYLNGAILGMRKVEIDRKFDEIVDFSEMGKFIDTPVKFYSTGMGVRLAFAVAAHLEPEILLVDEVLAVGDANFQKKCLNKMEDVGRKGRTVMFISHHMPSITRLCERAILMHDGKVMMDGPTFEVVGRYMSNSLGTKAEQVWPILSEAPGDEIVRLKAVRIIGADGKVRDHFDIREPIGIQLEYVVQDGGYEISPGFSLHNEEGQWLFSSLDTDLKWSRKLRTRGHYVSEGWIPGNLLAEGTMFVGPTLRSNPTDELFVYERDAVAFQISETPGEQITARMDFSHHLPGLMRPLLKWETRNFPGKENS
jgi:lipopolysaccharide transport system ATP-binding protein